MYYSLFHNLIALQLCLFFHLIGTMLATSDTLYLPICLVDDGLDIVSSIYIPIMAIQHGSMSSSG